jgi:hypothetical protein
MKTSPVRSMSGEDRTEWTSLIRSSLNWTSLIRYWSERSKPNWHGSCMSRMEWTRPYESWTMWTMWPL